MYGLGRSTGDGAGDLLIMIGVMLLLLGTWFVHRTYNEWRGAYDTNSRMMALYTMVIGGVFALAGIVLVVMGHDHVMEWLANNRSNRNSYSQIYASHASSDPPLEIFGWELPYSLARYERAFDAGGMMSLTFAVVFFLGLYFIWGSTAALIRRDFSVTNWSAYVYGILFGLGMVAVSLVLGYNWLNHVVRST